MKNFYLPSLFLVFCCFLVSNVQAQLDVSAVLTDYTIDFDNTVADVNNGQWLGTEPVAVPADGELDSDAWLMTPVDFEGQGGTAAGWHGFFVETGNIAMGAQPSSGFNAHSSTLTITNNTGEEVIGLNISFKLYARDDQGRNSTITYTGASGTNNIGTETTDNIFANGTDSGTTDWKYIDQSLSITDLTLADAATYTIVWDTDRGTGSGSSDEWALDDIVISAVGATSATITTNDVTSPFCIDDMNGAAVDVTFTTTGTFIGIFTAELSDANGDFTTPTNIGMNMMSPIAATIPAGLPSGTGYQIRVTNVDPMTESPPTTAFEIINGVPEVSAEMAMAGDMEATVSWMLPSGCYDEILVVANETAGIDFAPTGDGTAYTANPVYAAPDQVVYKGTGTTETVTALTNGTTYYFEIFVRQGMTWSVGVEVSVTPDIAPSCEDFTNFPETGSGYGSGMFVGNDGSTWNYVQCRGDQDITAPTPMLRNTNDAEMTSGTISGGIGDLTFNYQQAFGTNVNMEIFVNGVSIGTVTSSGETGVLKMASFPAVNQPGDFTISFKRAGSGGQALLDDVCWTSYEAPPCEEPMSPPTALNLTPDDTSISGTFTGTDDGYLVVMSTMSDLMNMSDPMDGTTYAVNDAIGNGTVIAVGNMTSFTTMGLTPNTQYYFFIFAYEAGCIGEPNYLSTPLTGDATTTVALFDCFIDNCSFDIVPVTLNSDMDNWSCTDGTYTANGFCGCDDPSDLWLISPIFDFGMNSIRNFKMDVLENFDGSDLKLQYSTDYAGDPSAATWNLIATYDASTSASEDISTLLDNTTNVVFGIQYMIPNGQPGVSGYEVSNIVIEADDCAEITNPCSIVGISTTNASDCIDNMTPDNGDDDYFTVDVVVEFLGAPATGNLTLTGDVMAGGGDLSAPITSSPQTFVGIRVPANGSAISITATFDDAMPACTLTNAEAHPGLSNCLPIPWKETFDTPGEGVVGGCPDATDLSMCATNNNPSSNGQWSIVLGDGGDLTFFTNGSDYFQTVNTGVLEARDAQTRICFESEVIDISSTPVDFSVELEARGGLEANDYADVILIVDGVETQIPNWNGNGDAMHTLIDDFGAQTVTSGGITGNTLQIQICVFTSAGAEYITIDNICVTESICRIADIAVDNVGTCDPNEPSILTDDFYTADVTVTFSTIPTTGTLDLTGDIVGMPPSVDASTLMGTSYTFVGVQLAADGTPVDLTATFSDDMTCTYSETGVDPGMQPCCAVSLAVMNVSACDNGGTVGLDMTDDDTFSADVEVTYFNAPTMGNLVLSGDGFADMTVDVTMISSPYTFNLTGLPADGTDLNIMASFSEDMTCMGMDIILGVEECSSTTTDGGLLLNEVGDESQTLSSLFGNPEYIELLVIGDAANPSLNVDVSGWIIDDNNNIASEFGTTSQSNGCLRIKAGCLTDVPPGSLIVIYNDSETINSMPAIDEDDTNPMDNVYIIPSSSTCLEVTTDAISVEADYTNNTYEPTVATSWVQVLALANGSGDVVQTRKPDGSFYHGMAYILSGVPYPNFPNGNPSFTAGNNHNISFSCGNSTIAAEYPASAAFTPGAANNSDNMVIIEALQNETANYNELIGTDMPSGNCAALAVELIDFTATLDNKEVILKWITASEKDNDRFEVEHSIDGQTFKKIGTVNSKGDATSRQDYRFTHQQLVEGNNYYRLRVVDLNNDVEYSSVETVLHQTLAGDISIYPVPVENILHIDCSKISTIVKEISLINANGQAVETMQIAEDTPIVEVSLNKQSAGLYWVKIVTETETITRKVIKQ